MWHIICVQWAFLRSNKTDTIKNWKRPSYLENRDIILDWKRQWELHQGELFEVHGEGKRQRNQVERKESISLCGVDGAGQREW